MELDGYMTVEASTVVYNHMNRNGLLHYRCFNKEVERQLAKEVAMQIAAEPIAMTRMVFLKKRSRKEIEVAIEKTKAEQVEGC